MPRPSHSPAAQIYQEPHATPTKRYRPPATTTTTSTAPASNAAPAAASFASLHSSSASPRRGPTLSAPPSPAEEALRDELARSQERCHALEAAAERVFGYAAAAAAAASSSSPCSSPGAKEDASEAEHGVTCACAACVVAKSERVRADALQKQLRRERQRRVEGDDALREARERLRSEMERRRELEWALREMEMERRRVAEDEAAERFREDVRDIERRRGVGAVAESLREGGKGDIGERGKGAGELRKDARRRWGGLCMDETGRRQVEGGHDGGAPGGNCVGHAGDDDNIGDADVDMARKEDIASDSGPGGSGVSVGTVRALIAERERNIRKEASERVSVRICARPRAATISHGLKLLTVAEKPPQRRSFIRTRLGVDSAVAL